MNYDSDDETKTNSIFFNLLFQKRVMIKRHNYFYKPIADTPFSLGVALPETYGMFELDLELELKHAHMEDNGKFHSFLHNNSNSLI